MVKAKFKCESNIFSEATQSSDVTLWAVVANKDGSYNKDNESWSKYTPFGKLNMNITNPDAFNQFEPGEEYYLTLEKDNK